MKIFIAFALVALGSQVSAQTCSGHVANGTYEIKCSNTTQSPVLVCSVNWTFNMASGPYREVNTSFNVLKGTMNQVFWSGSSMNGAAITGSRTLLTSSCKAN